jgi:hypothetical protein
MVTWGLPVLRASVRYRPRIQAAPQADWRDRGIMLKTFREAAICRQRWRRRGALWKLKKTRFAEAADQGGTRSPLLPAVIEGGAGLDPEVDRPSGAATDEPAANLNIEAASQPSSSGANSSQNLGGASADAKGEQQQQQAQQEQQQQQAQQLISSAADALAPLPPTTVGERQPPEYRTWRDSHHTGETNAQKRARYLPLFPEASVRLKDAAVEVAAQLEVVVVYYCST